MRRTFYSIKCNRLLYVVYSIQLLYIYSLFSGTFLDPKLESTADTEFVTVAKPGNKSIFLATEAKKSSKLFLSQCQEKLLFFAAKKWKLKCYNVVLSKAFDILKRVYDKFANEFYDSKFLPAIF